MADQTAILDGFFKNIPIRIESSSVSGGRKTSKKEFPNRDTQTIEDLGLRPRTYNLQIVIAPITTTQNGATNTQQSYFEYRDSIISAVEDRTTGTLIHPLYGRIDNVKATIFSIDENFSDFGRSRLNVTFEVSDDTGIPRQTITTVSQLAASNTAVINQVTADIEENYEVTTKFTNNFADAKTKIQEIIDSATEATSFIGAAADEINEFNSFLGQLSADINNLVTDPLRLATNIANLFSNIDGLFGTLGATVSSFGDLFTDDSIAGTSIAFSNLFGFGDNDEEEIQTTTAGRTERKNNRAVLNSSMNVLALSYSYVSVSEIDFEDARNVEVVADFVEVQYQAIVQSDPSDDVLSSLTDMRVIVQQFLDEQKTTAKEIVDIRTNIIPIRVLTFQYYGETDNTDRLIALNNIDDVSFVEGDLEILTA